ncbi:hypothetical protein Tco_0236346 [Tanacetum coccineum]
MCYIIDIEPQFENIISNGSYIPMAASQRKPETQWTLEERKAANLDQRLKSLIMSVLLDNQMNSIINCLNAKSTWDDLILYHERPSDVKESRVMDIKLCYNTFKFKEGESLTQTFTSYKALMNDLVNDGIKLSKLEINTESELASLFGKYEENLINNIYDTDKEKTLVPDEEEVLFDDNEVTEVKALMALADEERVSIGKESARNGEWIKISMKKVHTLLEMEDNDERKSFPDYLCIDLNYVEEQRNNFMSTHRNLVQELNTCKEQRLLNSSNKVNQCTSEQIPTQNNKILGIDQLTKDTSNSGPKDLVFVKSSADNSEVFITGSNKPKLSETVDSTLSNHDTVIPKTIKSILKSKSTFKAETLKDIIINELSSTPARGNKISSTSKTNSAPAGKLKNEKIKEDPPLAIVIKELKELKLQISKKKSSYFRNKNTQQYKKTNHRTCDHAEFVSSMNINQYHTGQGPELNGKAVNESQYRGMIGSLMNLTACKPDIQFLTGLYARHQANIRNPTLLLLRELSAMFSAEAEDIAATGCCTNILWIKSQLTGYDIIYEKVSLSIPTSGIYGEVGVNTFRNAIGAHYLPRSSEYVTPASIDIVSLANGINIDYANIFWEDIIIKLNKRHREKVVPYTRFLSLLMMHKMKEGYGDGELTLYPTQVFSVNN